jgi:hypothetical protein
VAPKTALVMVTCSPTSPVAGEICVIAGTAAEIDRLRPCVTALVVLRQRIAGGAKLYSRPALPTRKLVVLQRRSRK